MEVTVAQARECHQKALQHWGLSNHFRRQRDELIRGAYAEGDVSYGSLAKQIGCSPELIAKAVQQR